MIMDGAEGLIFKLSALGLYITAPAVHVKSRRINPPVFLDMTVVILAIVLRT